ncbi:IS4 family transposase [Pantoea ananatis]|uniref:IS4 family transposase n=2 Tax=Pantoea ananas TaxID=553 RepID=UPI00158956F5|nr:IS4 family transposase [Pantoea ananatis]QKV87391.1 IS4 family transposase [Pantoea ananatis]QKV89498.1 IS4 family transposase [Pantoea ananatis]
MQLCQALDIVSRYDSLRNPLNTLADVLDPALISRCLEEAGTVTLRKRRPTTDMMVWCLIGMALERKEPLHAIVNRLDILLPGNRPFVAPSAVVQARQRLGDDAVRRVFEQSSELWNAQTSHPDWCGLTLYAVDGVVWRTPETPDNEKAFVRSGTVAGASPYPQVRMVCLMELTSHLISGAAMGCQNENEMVLAEGLIERACDNSLTLFDKGYTSFGLLSAWHEAGENRHWMIAARKDLQYEEVRRLGKGDMLIRIKTSAQSRKKWPHLAAHTEMRMISREIKGRTWRFLTSMTDAMRYPGKEIADLYSHRWEIELGYREIKQGLQDSRLTLRSRKAEMVRQELWGVLLAYNLVRYQMIRMASTLKGYWPNQLSFRESTAWVMKLLWTLEGASPGRIPELVKDVSSIAEMVRLPGRRERSFPRVVKERPYKYPTARRKNASQA